MKKILAVLSMLLFAAVLVLTPYAPSPAIATTSGKGAGGWPNPYYGILDKLNATWFHQWNLCTESGGWYWYPDECISHVKNSWQYDEEDIKDDLTWCAEDGPGWFMFGDEWNNPYWGWDPWWSHGRDELNWFIELFREWEDEWEPPPHSGAQPCKIVVGGMLTDHPEFPAGYLAIYMLKIKYVEKYEEWPEEIRAITVHHYDWPIIPYSGCNLDDYIDIAEGVREDFDEYYNDGEIELELWADEIGVLTSWEDCGEDVAALTSDLLNGSFNRVAWYIIHEDAYWDLIDDYGDLTDIGVVYADE